MNHKMTYGEHYHAAVAGALADLERAARAILREHVEFSEFVMGMGVWEFWYADRDDFENDLDDPRFAGVAKIINTWDDYLKLTGEAVRFTADGPRVTVW